MGDLTTLWFFNYVIDVPNFIRSINKALNFPAFWENEVLLNALFYYLFYLFINQ